MLFFLVNVAVFLYRTKLYFFKDRISTASYFHFVCCLFLNTEDFLDAIDAHLKKKMGL